MLQATATSHHRDARRESRPCGMRTEVRPVRPASFARQTGPSLPEIPNSSAPAFWTAADLQRLFGLPAALMAALAPVGVAGPAHRRHIENVPPGTKLYDPEPVAEVLRARAGMKSELDDFDPDPAGPLPPVIGTDATPKAIRRRLFAADRTCRYCGNGIRTASRATIDHMIPVSRGGSDDASNLTLACHRCNGAKADRTPAEWARAILSAKPAVNDDALAWAEADERWSRVRLTADVEPSVRDLGRLPR